MTEIPIILLYEIWVTQHPYSFQNISSTNLHQYEFIRQQRFTTRKVTILNCMHMQSITLNILKLIEKFLYIISNRYSEIICAKYDSSIMNDACTVCPADYVGLPAKVVQPTAFFLKKKEIFVQLLCQPLAS